MMFSCGCHAVCRIFLLKSKQSTPISSFLRLPPVHTLRGFSTVLGFMFSRDASSVTSRFESRSNIRKKLLYEPVITCLQHNNTDRSESMPWRTTDWNQTHNSTSVSDRGLDQSRERRRCLEIFPCVCCVIWIQRRHGQFTMAEQKDSMWNLQMFAGHGTSTVHFSLCRTFSLRVAVPVHIFVLWQRTQVTTPNVFTGK